MSLFQLAALTRRRFLTGGAALMMATALPGQRLAAAPLGVHDDDLDTRDRAYLFLDAMMDGYSSTALRLPQSYSDQQGLQTTAFVYDTSLVIIAYLARGTAQDRARAEVLGDSLLYAQHHDPVYSDGRLRQAYFVDPFVLPDGSVNLAGWPFYFCGSAVGDLAWSGLALAHLAHHTGAQRYLDGAVRLGRWIIDHTTDERGAGGYWYGVDGDNAPLTYKSTEHNIDSFGLFSLLAELTGDDAWDTAAQRARHFVRSMWNPVGGHFWTGTGPDGVTTNTGPIPQDVQSWAFLAFHDHQSATAVDWVRDNLDTTDKPAAPNSSLAVDQRFTGVTFSSASLTADPNVQPNPYTPKPNPQAVWFEGTAQLAAALGSRTGRADWAIAASLLDTIEEAQAELAPGQTVAGRPLPAAAGIVAASSMLDTGFGFSYFPNLHVGATAWYCIALQGANPYKF